MVAKKQKQAVDLAPLKVSENGIDRHIYRALDMASHVEYNIMAERNMVALNT